MPYFWIPKKAPFARSRAELHQRLSEKLPKGYIVPDVLNIGSQASPDQAREAADRQRWAEKRAGMR